MDVAAWLETVSGEGWAWWVKRLSANDTGATGAHQVGPYVPKPVVERLWPKLLKARDLNPDLTLHAAFPQHESHGFEVRLVYYNNAVVEKGGTRDECRITRWGHGSPMKEESNTGAIAIFAFLPSQARCLVWICESAEQEDVVEARIGAVEPGIDRFIVPSQPGAEPQEARGRCALSDGEIPGPWKREFPDAATLAEMSVVRARTAKGATPDDRLLARRECEYQIFLSVERVHVLPRLQRPFSSVDEFIEYANGVANRRKSRSGRSLELQVKRIFEEEGVPFAWGATSEGDKRPDFLFPSVDAYRNPKTPSGALHMLAVKTTCKDRWRQILNEADRVKEKHLLTLQEGVSDAQHREMRDAHVRLVVPARLHAKYPARVRAELMTVSSFAELAAGPFKEHLQY